MCCTTSDPKLKATEINAIDGLSCRNAQRRGLSVLANTVHRHGAIAPIPNPGNRVVSDAPEDDHPAVLDGERAHADAAAGGARNSVADIDRIEGFKGGAVPGSSSGCRF